MNNYKFFLLINLSFCFGIFGLAENVNSQTVTEEFIPKLPEKDSTEAQDLIILNTELVGQNEETTEDNEQKAPNFTSSLGSFLGDGFDNPTALQGATRRKPILLGSNQSGGFALPDVHYQIDFNEKQNLLFSGRIGTTILAFDAQYSNLSKDNPRQGWGVDVFNQRSYLPAFMEGETEVTLANGNDPWIHRLGTGVEYAFPITKKFNTAVGISYQKVSVRDDMFSSNVQSKDEFGNQFTVSNDGQDLLLTANLSAFYENVDDPLFPNKGSRIRIGLDQAIPVGDAAIGFTKISGNYSQFIPLFSKKDTLILNFQAGEMFGDVPSYEAFALGGHGSVRGYKKGEVGTGSSFVLASAEYRFPLTDIKLIGVNIGLHGSLFVDYGSNLGTSNEVIGNPDDPRNKPGDGLGYGVGLLGKSPFGPIRLEFGFNDQGNTRFEFTISDRY